MAPTKRPVQSKGKKQKKEKVARTAAHEDDDQSQPRAQASTSNLGMPGSHDMILQRDDSGQPFYASRIENWQEDDSAPRAQVASHQSQSSRAKSTTSSKRSASVTSSQRMVTRSFHSRTLPTVGEDRVVESHETSLKKKTSRKTSHVERTGNIYLSQNVPRIVASNASLNLANTMQLRRRSASSATGSTTSQQSNESPNTRARTEAAKQVEALNALAISTSDTTSIISSCPTASPVKRRLDLSHAIVRLPNVPSGPSDAKRRTVPPKVWDGDLETMGQAEVKRLRKRAARGEIKISHNKGCLELGERLNVRDVLKEAAEETPALRPSAGSLANSLIGAGEIVTDQNVKYCWINAQDQYSSTRTEGATESFAFCVSGHYSSYTMHGDIVQRSYVSPTIVMIPATRMVYPITLAQGITASGTELASSQTQDKSVFESALLAYGIPNNVATYLSNLTSFILPTTLQPDLQFIFWLGMQAYLDTVYVQKFEPTLKLKLRNTSTWANSRMIVAASMKRDALGADNNAFFKEAKGVCLYFSQAAELALATVLLRFISKDKVVGGIYEPRTCASHVRRTACIDVQGIDVYLLFGSLWADIDAVNEALPKAEDLIQNPALIGIAMHRIAIKYGNIRQLCDAMARVVPIACGPVYPVREAEDTDGGQGAQQEVNHGATPVNTGGDVTMQVRKIAFSSFLECGLIRCTTISLPSVATHPLLLSSLAAHGNSNILDRSAARSEAKTVPSATSASNLDAETARMSQDCLTFFNMKQASKSTTPITSILALVNLTDLATDAVADMAGVTWSAIRAMLGDGSWVQDRLTNLILDPVTNSTSNSAICRAARTLIQRLINIQWPHNAYSTTTNMREGIVDPDVVSRMGYKNQNVFRNYSGFWAWSGFIAMIPDCITVARNFTPSGSLSATLRRQANSNRYLFRLFDLVEPTWWDEVVRQFDSSKQVELMDEVSLFIYAVILAAERVNAKLWNRPPASVPRTDDGIMLRAEHYPEEWEWLLDGDEIVERFAFNKVWPDATKTRAFISDCEYECPKWIHLNWNLASYSISVNTFRIVNSCHTDCEYYVPMLDLTDLPAEFRIELDQWTLVGPNNVQTMQVAPGYKMNLARTPLVRQTNQNVVQPQFRPVATQLRKAVDSSVSNLTLIPPPRQSGDESPPDDNNSDRGSHSNVSQVDVGTNPAINTTAHEQTPPVGDAQASAEAQGTQDPPVAQTPINTIPVTAPEQPLQVAEQPPAQETVAAPVQEAGVTTAATDSLN